MSSRLYFSLIFLFALFRISFAENKKVYERLGQHNYISIDFDREVEVMRGTMPDGKKWIYYGQTWKNGKQDGVGIGVTSWGTTFWFIFYN